MIFTEDHDVELVIPYYSKIIGLNLKSGHSSVYLDSHAILGIDYTVTCDYTYYHQQCVLFGVF